MSLAKLLPGDRVIFKSGGRKLRGVVADFLPMTRGKHLELPIIRPRNIARCNADKMGAKPPKVRWIKRSLLRKLQD